MAKSKIDKLYGNPRKAKKADTEADSALLKVARERARDGAGYWKDNWKAAEDDLKFLAGEQWPSQVRTEREAEQRPCLTNNVLPTFVDRILGEQRQNRPSIKVNPVDMIRVEVGEEKQETLKISNTAGTKDYELSEVFTGLIRNIEYQCDAETSYDIGFQSAVESSMGFLRVLADYTDDESFEQDLKIKHIENQFAVTMDPNAKERDWSDMNWCFIDDTMEKEVFKKKYPDAHADPVNSDSVDEMGTWYSDNTVRISEYFTREPVIREVALLVGGDGKYSGKSVYMDELEPIIDELIEQGVTIKRTRKVNTYKVFWRKITGLNILEGPIEIPCSTIPVVPIWGKSIVIKKKIIFRSSIRHSKDAQRMANYWDSAATEAVALAPKAPFIGAEGHIEGREDEWKKANTSNQAILTYIPQSPTDRGPRREQPAAIPAAEITLGMSSGDKIKATMGMFDASLGAAGNETSGKAITARQRQGERGTFVFIDNLSKAMTRVGRILVEMIPYVIDTERVVRLKFADETEDFVKLNEQVLDEESNEWVTINDLSVAKYDVVVTTGPAFATQRQEAADTMMLFAKAVPGAGAVMGDIIAQNMDWPGADMLAARLKKVVDPRVLTNEEREKIAEDAPEDPGPSPEQEVQMKEFEARTAEANSKVAEAEADTLKAQLETAEAKQALNAINESGGDLAGTVKELVAQAIAEIMQNRQG